MARRFLTAEDVHRLGGPVIEVDAATIVTPQAQEAAASMGVAIQTSSGGAARPWTPPPPDRGPDAERALQSLSRLPEPSGDSSSNGVIVTVVGRNRPGVLAEITAHLAALGCNVHKVSQEIVDGYFHLILTIELAGGGTFEALKADIECLGGPDDFVARAMHERVFRFMHRI